MRMKKTIKSDDHHENGFTSLFIRTYKHNNGECDPCGPCACCPTRECGKMRGAQLCNQVCFSQISRMDICFFQKREREGTPEPTKIDHMYTIVHMYHAYITSILLLLNLSRHQVNSTAMSLHPGAHLEVVCRGGIAGLRSAPMKQFPALRGQHL